MLSVPSKSFAELQAPAEGPVALIVKDAVIGQPINKLFEMVDSCHNLAATDVLDM
jgi:hypothetical protein